MIVDTELVAHVPNKDILFPQALLVPVQMTSVHQQHTRTQKAIQQETERSVSMGLASVLVTRADSLPFGLTFSWRS